MEGNSISDLAPHSHPPAVSVRKVLRCSVACKQCGSRDKLCPTTQVPCQGVKPERHLCDGYAMPDQRVLLPDGRPGVFLLPYPHPSRSAYVDAERD